MRRMIDWTAERARARAERRVAGNALIAGAVAFAAVMFAHWALAGAVAAARLQAGAW